MATDEELLELMKIQEESPDDPRRRKIVKRVYPKSKFDVKDLATKIGDKVWVKCITDLAPWANGAPLVYWKEYLVSLEDAIALDERRFAVILHSEEFMNNTKTTK